jgi:magnesium-protoporphyrin O-methyltransferase
MDCCQIQGIEEVFNQPLVEKELKRYRRKGPIKTTRMLIEAIRAGGVKGMTLLDIGGGVGAVQHALLQTGVSKATDVDASAAYLAATRNEAQRRGLAEQISYHHGNFVDLAAEIPEADIVTLDRVICCYNDMECLVDLSAAKAKQRYGLVYTRNTWWLKLAMKIGNFFLRLQKNQYRMFA